MASNGATTSTTASAATTAEDGGSLPSNSIPIVDLRLLSQSELLSLSLYSPPPSFCDDVVIPVIDRSVFNESAGSRKQTYSRLRLAPPSLSGAIPRRRTPHLRATATFSNIASSDPENAENARIVTMLKQLFVSNTDPGELVPVKLDYSHSILPQQLISNVTPTGQKRKRGRPRKDEVLKVMERVSTVEVSVIDVKDSMAGLPSMNEIDVRGNAEHGDEEVLNKDNVAGLPLMNEIAVREIAEHGDKEVLNKDGVAVDLVTLGAIDHPFWDEISRRTEGLKSEEELLGFMKELNGQWGSRRKKKRVVDASEFGNALPIGWKLLLSAKKKNGHVWLYCRRYISPSGRQFESCKEVSSYLLSLYGIEARHDDADQLTSASVEDLASQKESLASHASSPGLACRSDSIIIKSPDLPDGRVGESLHCKKCDITFNERVELLQHQSSFHTRNRSRNAVSLTDGVIIKDGKYECQFCHKMFEERHRYNGHIGAHVRYQAKMAGEFAAGGTGESVDPISSNELFVQDAAVGSDNVSATCNVSIDNGLNFPLHSEDIDNVGNSKETTENVRGIDEATDAVMGGIDEATDAVTGGSPRSVAEVFISSNESKGFYEASDPPACVDGSATEIVADESSFQGRSGNCLPSEETHDVDVVIENISSELDQDKVSESSLLDSNNHMETCNIVENNGQSCQTSNELKLDGKNFAVNESIFEFFESHDGQGKDFGKTNSTSNRQLDITMLAPSNNEKSSGEENVHSIGKSTADESSFGTHEKCAPEMGDDDVSRHTEMQFGITLSTPSWNVQENLSREYDFEVSACLFKEPAVQNTSGTNDDGVCGRNMEVPEFDAVQNFNNGELSNPFHRSHSVLNSNSAAGTNQDRQLGVCTAFSSITDKQYFKGDNMSRVFGSALEENKQEQSGGVLFGQSGVSKVSNTGYNANIYPTTANQSRNNESESNQNYGLSLSFGNFLTELHPASNRFEQERYPTESYSIPSVVDKTYDGRSVINSNIQGGDLRQGHHFGVDFLDSSFNNSHNKLCGSFNSAPLGGGDWNGPRGDKVENSGQNTMLGFGTSSSQPAEHVIANGSWTTGRGNMFHSFDGGASIPQVQGSSRFHNFDLMPDKGGEVGSSGVHTNNIARNNNPVEYSFMEEQSSDTRSGESQQIFSYTEQRLDPSFWLGRDALMQQHNAATTTTTTQVKTVCVWCRNVFYHEPPPLQPGTQTGAIGSMCPSCSSRMPGQFNLL